MAVPMARNTLAPELVVDTHCSLFESPGLSVSVWVSIHPEPFVTEAASATQAGKAAENIK